MLKLNKIILSSIFLIIISLTISSCGNKNIVFKETNNSYFINKSEINSINDSYIQVISNNINRFGFNLYDKLSKNDSNVFFSPFSIYDALTIAYEGARGKTKKEMYSLLGIPNRNKKYELSFLKILSLLKGNKNYDLSVANAIWIDKKFPIYNLYKNIVKICYNSETKNLDLNSKKDVQIIENWIKKKTNNKISMSIKPNPHLVMLITNAIYFKGNWSIPFDKSLTEKENFYESPKKTIKVKMMAFKNDHYFKYKETKEFQALEMNYNGSNLSMLVILPKKSYNLNKINISKINLLSLEDSMKKQKVRVFFPKFSFKTNYKLNKYLTKMGIPIAFNSDLANFTGMYNPKKLKRNEKNVYISTVLHKAYINVTESGTEAAAVTIVKMRVATAIAPHHNPIPVFKADHPFTFFIIDKNTNIVLFMGKVVNPNAS